MCVDASDCASTRLLWCSVHLACAKQFHFFAQLARLACKYGDVCPMRVGGGREGKCECNVNHAKSNGDRDSPCNVGEIDGCEVASLQKVVECVLCAQASFLLLVICCHGGQLDEVLLEREIQLAGWVLFRNAPLLSEASRASSTETSIDPWQIWQEEC